jgi:O-antigen/teichoic acid export membrane protein
VFTKIAQTFGTKLATAIINFLIAVAVSQFLGAEGKGEQGILITTIALVLIFSNIVGGASLVYLVPRYPAWRLMIPAFIWSVLMGAVLGSAFAIFKVIPMEWAWPVALLSILNSWVSILSSVMIGKEKIGRSNIVNFLQSLITILMLLVLIKGFGIRDIRSYTYSLFTAYTLCLLIAFLLLPKLRTAAGEAVTSNARIISELFKYGFMNQLAHIAQILSFRISYFFLDKLTGEKAVGIYSNGVSLMESVWMISGSIALVQYAGIANSNDKAWARDISARLTRYSLWASLFVILPLVILPPAVYVFIFGPEFSGVCHVMRYLAPGVFIFNYALVTGHYFSGTGKYHVNAIASAAGLVVTIVLAMLLIPLYSINGAAMAASLSYAVTSAVVFIWFVKESGAPLRDMIPQFGDLKQLYREGMKKLRPNAQKNTTHE